MYCILAKAIIELWLFVDTKNDLETIQKQYKSKKFILTYDGWCDIVEKEKGGKAIC